MTRLGLVTYEELDAALKDLDRKQESRLYSVQDNLKAHFDDSALVPLHSA